MSVDSSNAQRLILFRTNSFKIPTKESNSYGQDDERVVLERLRQPENKFRFLFIRLKTLDLPLLRILRNLNHPGQMLILTYLL